jgi:hypothetical protein
MSTAELRQMIASLVESQKETDRQLKETSREIGKLTRLFESHWGKLVEALLGTGLPKLFRQRGIGVRKATKGLEIFDETTGRCLLEVDVMVHDGDEDIAVEVKTTCRPDDIDEHIERLAALRALEPAYASGEKRLYGAVAALSYAAHADRYAERKGLFVLKSTDGVLSIENGPDFKPKAF